MRFLLLALLLPLWPGLVSAAEAPRPNILYLYVDDMGWGSIGPNGQDARRAKGLPSVLTPHLDRLAASGVNFRRGYGCHVCSPARSSQQSGFHQGHTFADRNDPDNAKKAMRADDLLMGDVLSAAGYATGYWGKWGYGGSKDMENPTLDNLQTLPTSHGYQHVLAELHHVRAHTFFQPTLWSAPAKAGIEGGLELKPNSMGPFTGEAYPKTPAHQNHPQYPMPAYCDDTYAFAALDFIRREAQEYHQSGRPFFGLFAAQIPHSPFDEVAKLPNWNEAYRDDEKFRDHPKQAQQWAAMVTRIDAHFGNLLAALEDPNGDGDKSDSVAKDTLVVFQSDNGGPSGSNNGVFDANGGLRGNKGSVWEGGIRVPLVMRWPARIHANSKLIAGSDTERIVDVTDLLPTFCDLAGVARPLGIDGVSIAPFLSGEGVQRERAFIVHEASRQASIIEGNWKLIRDVKEKSVALYDLQADPAEKTDLADTNRKLVKRLEKQILEERVNEPNGFANTYHHWTGPDGGSISEADHWSDYEYANAGITYMTETGAPNAAWCAQLANSSSEPAVAVVDKRTEFLGLQVGGGAALQTLRVDKSGVLVGRNEIRVGDNGRLELAGGALLTMRWLEIGQGGVLAGAGLVSGDVFQNGGTIEANGTLEFDGTAYLDGPLVVGLQSAGAMLKASRIEGRFTNADDEVTDRNGKRYRIHYGQDQVSLKPLE